MNQYKEGLFFSYDFVGENSWNGYERNCLFANVGGGQFTDVARPTGADGVRDGRGVAIADFDSDGRLDLAINNNNAPPTIYWNRLGSGNWLRFELVGRESNRDAVGARVRLTLDAGGSKKVLTRWVEAGSGYASQSDFPLHFGLGTAETIEVVSIEWPSGAVTRLAGEDVGLNRTLRVDEAAGVAVASLAEGESASAFGG